MQKEKQLELNKEKALTNPVLRSTKMKHQKCSIWSSEWVQVLKKY